MFSIHIMIRLIFSSTFYSSLILKCLPMVTIFHVLKPCTVKVKIKIPVPTVNKAQNATRRKSGNLQNQAEETVRRAENGRRGALAGQSRWRPHSLRPPSTALLERESQWRPEASDGTEGLRWDVPLCLVTRRYDKIGAVSVTNLCCQLSVSPWPKL